MSLTISKWTALLRGPHSFLRLPDFYFPWLVVELLFDDTQDDIPFPAAESAAQAQGSPMLIGFFLTKSLLARK